MNRHRIPNLLVRCCSWLALSVFPIQGANAETYLWNVATPADNNWNVNANWAPATGNPSAADTAVFSDFGAGTDSYIGNNTVSASTAIASLFYTNTVLGNWHVTQIPAGTTLTVTDKVMIGGQVGTNFTTSVALRGDGTFLVSGTTNLFTIGNNFASGSATPGTLDLSGLSTFVYSATNGTIGIGTLPTGGIGSRTTGNLTLASGSNNITAATINMNGASGIAARDGATQVLNLGTGTNIINVNTFYVGAGRTTTTLKFYDIAGGLRLRGAGGTNGDRAMMVVGNRNAGGSVGGSSLNYGYVLLNGHPVDMKLATLTLGWMSRSGSGSTDVGGYNPRGDFEFDQGTVDATLVSMGVCSGNLPNFTTPFRATGILTVGTQGTLVAGDISLANVTSPQSAGAGGTGTLNISGGAVNCAGRIYKTTVTGSTGIVAVTSGKLTVGGSLGSSTNALDSLSLSDATVTLPVNTIDPNTVTALDTGGSTNVINIGSVPPIFGYPIQLPVLKYTGAIGGMGFDYNIGLGTLPEANPAYAGYLSNNTANASIDLVLTGGPLSVLPPPQIRTVIRTSDGNLQITGSGPGSAAYRILATTNLTWSLGTWPQIGSGNFVSDTFSFTDLNATNFPQRFYSVVTP